MLCALLCCLYCINFMSIRLMEQVSMRKWFICHLFMRCAFGSFFSWHLFFVYISNKWKRERKRKKISLTCRILCVFDGIWRSRSLFFKMRGIYYVKTGVVMNFYRISIAIMYESGFFLEFLNVSYISRSTRNRFNKSIYFKLCFFYFCFLKLQICRFRILLYCILGYAFLKMR